MGDTKHVILRFSVCKEHGCLVEDGRCPECEGREVADGLIRKMLHALRAVPGGEDAEKES